MDDGFTELEHTVFGEIGVDHPDIAAALAAFVETAKVTKRDNTGHGFYTHFDVDRSQPPLSAPSKIVHGPNLDVQVRDEVLEMGFILWLDEALYPQFLEAFQYATKGGGNIDLQAENLDVLASQGRMI